MRLPNGVFAPYTSIPTNLLFFDRSGPTKDVWYYEQPLPPHRAHLKGRSYSATDGIQYEEFVTLLRWWSDRKQTDQAWLLNVEPLRESGFDLALNHPRHAKVSLPTPKKIIGTVRRIKDHSEAILRELEETLSALTKVVAPALPLHDLLKPRRDSVRIEDDTEYMRPRVQLHFRGAKVRIKLRAAALGQKLRL